MSAETIIVMIAALLFLAGVNIMSAALDRITASVNSAVDALNAATTAAQNNPNNDAALSQLADNLDAAVTAYHNAVQPTA
jgi:hypothetical protein